MWCWRWLVFTSSVGARYFVGRMKELALATRWKGKPLVAAVGSGTKKALEGRGISVQFTPSEYLTEKLAAELPLDQGRRVLLLRTDIAERGMVLALQRRGFSVEAESIYRTQLPSAHGDADLGRVGAIIFASPSAIEGFCRRIAQRTFDSLLATPVLCMGPITAQAARARGFTRVTSPGTYTFESIIDELRRS